MDTPALEQVCKGDRRGSRIRDRATLRRSERSPPSAAKDELGCQVDLSQLRPSVAKVSCKSPSDGSTVPIGSRTSLARPGAVVHDQSQCSPYVVTCADFGEMGRDLRHLGAHSAPELMLVFHRLRQLQIVAHDHADRGSAARGVVQTDDDERSVRREAQEGRDCGEEVPRSRNTFGHRGLSVGICRHDAQSAPRRARRETIDLGRKKGMWTTPYPVENCRRQRPRPQGRSEVCANPL